MNPGEARAEELVRRLAETPDADGAAALDLLRRVAADPANLNVTPYLIAKLRDAGRWDSIQAADTKKPKRKL